MNHCTHHVYAWVSGYGLTVIPHGPYRMRFGSYGDNVLEIEHGSLYARITAEGGGYTSQIADGTASLYDVVHIESGPEDTRWMIETTPYRCLLPADYWLCSTGNDISLFNLVGPHEALIFFQSPKRMPPVAELVGEGQTVEDMELDGEVGWIELSYTHDGVPHRQRHTVLRRRPGNLALTVQAPADHFDDARRTMETVAGSLAFA